METREQNGSGRQKIDKKEMTGRKGTRQKQKK